MCVSWFAFEKTILSSSKATGSLFVLFCCCCWNRTFCVCVTFLKNIFLLILFSSTSYFQVQQILTHKERIQFRHHWFVALFDRFNFSSEGCIHIKSFITEIRFRTTSSDKKPFADAQDLSIIVDGIQVADIRWMSLLCSRAVTSVKIANQAN